MEKQKPTRKDWIVTALWFSIAVPLLIYAHQLSSLVPWLYK